jgi:hypothetical protein
MMSKLAKVMQVVIVQIKKSQETLGHIFIKDF